MSRRLVSLSTFAVLATAAFVTIPAIADDSDGAHWRTIVGVMQAGNLVGSGTGQVAGGGQPWSALGGHAEVDLRNGHVSFDVRGLVLAGGNGIGTPANITQVKGTLLCDTNGSASGGNSVLLDTPLVTLDEAGNARFSGSLGPLPAACTSEPDLAFLIRIAAGRWIANGAVLQ